MKLSLSIVLVLWASLTTVHAQPLRIVAGCAQPEAGVLEPVKSYLSGMRLAAPDPADVSLLIATALDLKAGLALTAKDVATVMDQPQRADRRSLLEVKQAIQKLGYRADGFRIDQSSDLDQVSGSMVFLVDHKLGQSRALMALLVASTDQDKYLLYSDGSVCPMSSSQFAQQFVNRAVVVVSGAPYLQSSGSQGLPQLAMQHRPNSP